jgi:hypothetical protein
MARPSSTARYNKRIEDCLVKIYIYIKIFNFIICAVYYQRYLDYEMDEMTEKSGGVALVLFK